MVNCNFCNGKGCLDCNFEVIKQKKDEQKMIKAEVMPEPLFVAKTDNNFDMGLLKQAVGKEAIDKAFGGGEGIPEIIQNLRKANIEQIKANLNPSFEKIKKNMKKEGSDGTKEVN